MVGSKGIQGRPPAEWMVAFANISLAEDRNLTLKEICELLKISRDSLYMFCKRNALEGEYRKVDGKVRNVYSLAKLQKAIKQYIDNKS